MTKYKHLVRVLPVLLVVALTLSFTTYAVQKPLVVSFIDVGQADSILIQSPHGYNMLIDAGNNEDDKTIISYLLSRKIKQIDILIGTHPHEDHIGAMDAVIKRLVIKKIYLPKVTANTEVFKDLLTAIKEKGLKVTAARSGAKLDFDSSVKVAMLAPNSNKYENLNDYSVVLKLVYGKTSFLFTGDAEKKSEFEMLAASSVIPKADLLKVGHHGSDTSTSAGFLKAVAPKYAVISVGAHNDYGHPGKSTLKRLKKAGFKIYRTDLNGTVMAVSNGRTITFKVEK